MAERVLTGGNQSQGDGLFSFTLIISHGILYQCYQISMGGWFCVSVMPPSLPIHLYPVSIRFLVIAIPAHEKLGLSLHVAYWGRG